MTNSGRFGVALLVSTALSSVPALAAPPPAAPTTASVNATSLLLGFSTLYNTTAGQTVLSQNLATTVGINNNATAAVQAQGIKDNTITSLIGSLQNGIIIADGLGNQLGAVYTAHTTTPNAYFGATAPTTNIQNLFNQVTALTVGGDNAFTKNFYANGSINGNAAFQAASPTLPSGGIFNVYDAAYKPQSNVNTIGDTRPYAVAPPTGTATPSTAATAAGLAEVSYTAPDFFGTSTSAATAIWPTLNGNAAFPSGHAEAGFVESMLMAIMVPERYQQLVARGAEFGNSRIVIGAHYALDVIGARIESIYALTQILNNNPLYTSQTVPGLLGGTVTTTSDFQALLSSATSDLRSTLTTGCGTTIAACNTTTTGDRFASTSADVSTYTDELTYGLSAVGPTNLDPVVPTGANVLVATRFPYLTAQQQSDVIASTEIASGQALDNGTGYARINLAAAANGYGALYNGTGGTITGNVAITMNATLGGYNAYDVWSNNIANYIQPSTGNTIVGSLTKGGTGTLELSGNDSWTGQTIINGGALLFSGTSNLGGNLTNNSVLSLTKQDGTSSRVLTLGSYTGGAGSVLAVGSTLTKPGATTDSLVLTNGVTAGSATAIAVYDTAPTTAASYNPVGMTVVSVPKGQPAAAGEFALSNGPINKGLFQYALAYKADPAWLLVGLPNSSAYRLATLQSATQSIWFDTNALRGDRQVELRDAFATNNEAQLLNPIWVRTSGIWQNRTDHRTTYDYNSSFASDASYNLNTTVVVAGLDGGLRNVIASGDSLLLGLNVGSIESRQVFKNSGDRGTYSGATVGASATYLRDGYFNDLSVKADLLTLSLSMPSISGFGISTQSRNANTYGVMDSAGYRFNLGTASYAEPLLTVAFAHSDIGAMTLANSTVTYPSADTVRGRIGVRAGTVFSEGNGHRLSVSGTASVWSRLAGSAKATINSGTSSPLLTLTDRAIPTFGEVGLNVDYASIGSGWSFFGKTNYQYATNYNEVSVEGGLRFKF